MKNESSDMTYLKHWEIGSLLTKIVSKWIFLPHALVNCSTENTCKTAVQLQTECKVVIVSAVAFVLLGR